MKFNIHPVTPTPTTRIGLLTLGALGCSVFSDISYLSGFEITGFFFLVTGVLCGAIAIYQIFLLLGIFK